MTGDLMKRWAGKCVSRAGWQQGVRARSRTVNCPLLVLLTGSVFWAGACSTPGDFGRQRESIIQGQITDSFNEITGNILNDRSNFVLNRDELELRRVLHHFRKALPTPLFPERVLYLIKKGDFGALSNYAHSLTSRGYADGGSRVAQISQMLETDHVYVKRFSEASKEIRLVDRSRVLILSRNPGQYSSDDRLNTSARARENVDLMLAVLLDLSYRLVAYDYAIERTRLEWPRTNLVHVEAILSMLREKAAFLRIDLGFDGPGLAGFEEVPVSRVSMRGPRRRGSAKDARRGRRRTDLSQAEAKAWAETDRWAAQVDAEVEAADRRR